MKINYMYFTLIERNFKLLWFYFIVLTESPKSVLQISTWLNI